MTREQKTVTARAQQAGEAFAHLVQIMARLRAPGGCPWDAEQDHASLIRYLVEESYEVVEAVEATDGVDLPALREELGDVLLQVVFHADIAAEERGGFTVTEVINELIEKLTARHPHVLGEATESQPETAADQEQLWEELKKQEKAQRAPLDGVPPSLPALAMAEKTVSKAKKADITLPPEPTSMDDDLPYMTNERDLGELLFTLVCRAHRNGLDAERALRSYTRKFIESNSHSY